MRGLGPLIYFSYIIYMESRQKTEIVHKSLTDTLEAYMTKTGFKGEYRLAPLKSELYAITTEEVMITIEPIKQYSIYGEF